MRFVEGGLQDLSISRTSFTWGIPVPGDPAHVMYVWLDALTNYITATGYPDISAERWRYWPADVHVVGKDIVRFHAIYWPAFLAAAGLAPPRRVFAHGWWTNEGQKISKSLGNVIDPVKLVEEYGLDPVRYFLLREVPFGNDGDFSRAALIGRLNGELADTLGNLANRTLSLIQRNCGGTLPAPAAAAEGDAELHAGLGSLPERVGAHVERQEFHLALEAILAEARAANGYITLQAPWALKKTDPLRMAVVLRHLHSALRVFATVLQPFMPDTMAAMLDQLGVPAEGRGLGVLAEPLPEGTPLPPPAPLFRKVEA
jgi:methionyl-tRNA synthetase